MSGLKEGALHASLGRLRDNINRFNELFNSSLNRFVTGVPSAVTAQSLRRMLDGIPGASSVAGEFAAAECRLLEVDIRAAREAVASAEQRIHAAGKLHDEALEACAGSASDFLARINAMAEEIASRAQHKIDTTDYYLLALDDEVAEIDALSRDVAVYHARMREAATMAGRTHDGVVAAQGDLGALSLRVQRLVARRDEVEQLAENRRQAKLLRDAQQASSERCNGEIALFVQKIGSMEFERFLPRGYEPIEERIDSFRESLSSGDFARCSEDGPGLVEELKAFLEKLEGLVDAFHSAEASVQARLKAAQDEIAAIDLAELKRWSQKPGEIQRALEDIEKSAGEIQRVSTSGNRAEEFDAPGKCIVEALETIRKFVGEATENHARYDARDGIRKAIRDALKELKYDKPVYYFQGELPEGGIDELSDLTIYAHNPANTGNMRLNLDMDGKLSFEVFREDEQGNELEVSQQDAVACHGAVLAFGERMTAAGFRLEVTDWGKAKDLPTAQERGRITWDDANPDKQGKSRQVAYEQERSRERQQESARE